MKKQSSFSSHFNILLSTITGLSIALSLLVYTSAWAAVSITDPSGDAYGASPFSDFLAMQITESDSKLTFKLDFVDLHQGAMGAILLDLDGNRQTHGNASSNITEARIEFHISIIGICTAIYYDHEENSEYLNCWVSGNSFYTDLSSSLLSSDIELLEVAAVASINFLCEGRDRIPDEGYLRMSSGEVHIDNEGLLLAPLSLLTDPADAPPPVDLKGMEIEVVGEHLVIRSHYQHLIGPHDINEASVGMVSLDADGDILTGFQNASGVFPTFGVDAYVFYTVYPWALGGNVDVTLTIQDSEQPVETASVQMGKFSSDSCFFRGSDFIELSIPLSLLPEMTDEALLLINAMEPVAGLFDSFPDGGAIQLTDGSLKSYNTCQSEEVYISDPLGDSFAFGGDNDDLLELRACSYEEGTLLSVNYSELQLIGEALTSIHFDIDQNISTGEHTLNFTGDTEIGVEKTLVSQLSSSAGTRPVARGSGSTKAYYGGGPGSSPFFTAIMVEGSSGDLIRGINSLYTLHFGLNRVYITIPHRLFNDNNGMDIHAVTMSGAFGTATFDDEIPNPGVFSLNDPNDIDGDGMPDTWERDYFGDLDTANETSDYDHDDLFDLDEYLHGSNPKKEDTDGDGFIDGEEVAAGSDPLSNVSMPVQLTLQLLPGFNLISIPVNTDTVADAYTLLPILGDDGQVDRILRLDNATGRFQVAGYDGAGNPTGDNFPVISGEGLIVYSNINRDIPFTGVITCPSNDLAAGINLTGLPCHSEGLTAFQLLQSIGDDIVVSSIQRFDPVTGNFGTAVMGSIEQAEGDDFPIEAGKGYIFYMKEDVLNFQP